MPYLIPTVLTLVGAAVAMLGFRFADKTGRPRLFKCASAVAAGGFVLLWLLPWWAIKQDAGIWSMPLVVAAFVVAVSVLGGGMSAMARAATGRAESDLDKIVTDLSYLNDAP